MELSLEEKFELQAKKIAIENMSLEQLQVELIEIYTKMIIRQAEMTQYLGEKWGIKVTDDNSTC